MEEQGGQLGQGFQGAGMTARVAVRTDWEDFPFVSLLMGEGEAEGIGIAGNFAAPDYPRPPLSGLFLTQSTALGERTSCSCWWQ